MKIAKYYNIFIIISLWCGLILGIPQLSYISKYFNNSGITIIVLIGQFYLFKKGGGVIIKRMSYLPKYNYHIIIAIHMSVTLIAFTKITCAVYNYFNSSVMKMITLWIGSICFAFASVILIKSIRILYILTKRNLKINLK